MAKGISRFWNGFHWEIAKAEAIDNYYNCSYTYDDTGNVTLISLKGPVSSATVRTIEYIYTGVDITQQITTIIGEKRITVTYEYNDVGDVINENKVEEVL